MLVLMPQDTLRIERVNLRIWKKGKPEGQIFIINKGIKAKVFESKKENIVIKEC